jgi:hypothetical protein
MTPVAATGGAPNDSAPLLPSDSRVATTLDETADTVPDYAATLVDQFAKRASLVLLAQQADQQQSQLKLDRMKAAFNDAQSVRSELLREANVLRDMAIEQSKKDDEVLKKYIAMI